MVKIVVDSFQNVRHEFLAEPFPFLVNIDITTTGEIDTLE